LQRRKLSNDWIPETVAPGVGQLGVTNSQEPILEEAYVTWAFDSKIKDDVIATSGYALYSLPLQLVTSAPTFAGNSFFPAL
jgi:hypothetical protein